MMRGHPLAAEGEEDDPYGMTPGRPKPVATQPPPAAMPAEPPISGGPPGPGNAFMEFLRRAGLGL